jgi:uncharacterized integral membrane protein
MTFAQSVLVVIILIILFVYMMINRGQYKPPKYPGFGQ